MYLDERISASNVRKFIQILSQQIVNFVKAEDLKRCRA